MIKKMCLVFSAVFILSVFSGCENAVTEADITPYSKEAMIIGYDGQDFFSSYSCMAESEDGYYYLDTSYMRAKNMNIVKYLMYFDKKTGTSFPVCSQPDCIHEAGDEGCNAQFMNTGTSDGLSSYPFSLWYYDESLYVIIMESEISTGINSWNLYRISSDGAIREKYGTMYENTGDDGGMVPAAIIHRGYLYYSVYADDNTNRLCRMKVSKNAEPEVLYEYNDLMTTLSNFKLYDTGIMYDRNYCIDGDKEEYRDDIEYYDIVTGKTRTILEDTANSSYAVAGDYIYYSHGGQIIKIGIDSGEPEVIFETETGNYVSYDGKYLYIEVNPYMIDSYGRHIIYVTDLEGRLVYSIAAPSTQTCYFGDEDYLFQMFDLNEDLSSTSDMPVVKAFDKSQIGTGKYEWIELPLP